jgi:hypothetical protein
MKNSKSEKKMKQKTKENPNQERYIRIREICNLDILFDLETSTEQIVENLNELKCRALTESKTDFDKSVDGSVYLLESLAELLQNGARNLQEYS